MKKRIFSVVLCVLLLTSVMSVSAFAAGGYDGDVSGGLHLYDSNTEKKVYTAGKGTVTYVPELDSSGALIGVSLTLNNATINNKSNPLDGYEDGIALYTDVPVTIYLVGNNFVSGDSEGIYSEGESLTITGSGTLSVTGRGDDAVDSTSGSITVRDTTLYLTAADDGLDASTSEDMHIINSNVEILSDSDCLWGGDIYVENSRMILRSTNAGGIDAEYGVSITDSTFDIETGNFGIFSYDDDVRIENSSLVINSGDYGISAYKKVDIIDSDTTITSVDNGIYSYDSYVSIDNSKIMINSEDDGISAYEGLQAEDSYFSIFAGNDGITTYYGVTVENCVFSIVADDEGFDAYDDINFFDCVIYITSGDDGIWGEYDINFYDSYGTISSGEDAICCEYLEVCDSQLKVVGARTAILIYGNGYYFEDVELVGAAYTDYHEDSYYTFYTAAGTVATDVTFKAENYANPNSPADPDKIYYLVNVEATIHGSIDVEVNAAQAGETIVIGLTSDKGYAPGSITVTAEDGSKADVTEIGDGKYAFVMPAADVVIKVVFTEGGAKPPAPDVDDDTSFDDVSEGDYFYDAVMWALESGFVSAEGGSFYPNLSSPRAEIVTYLWYAAGAPEPTLTENPFTDVKETDLFYKAVLWAVESGITKGMTDTTFAPYSTVTRGQAVTFLWRAAGSPEPEGEANPFADVSADDYFGDAVLWAIEERLTNGTSETAFSPNIDCTKAHIVTFLYRFIG